ncbi:MAG TPA: hypothetical protein VGE39_02490 [Prosthecobacter sp.]
MTPEDARFIVRKVLYSRPTAALPVETIRHHAARLGEDLTEAECSQAAEFLTGLQPAQAKVTNSGLGATKLYQITSAGCLAYERNE